MPRHTHVRGAEKYVVLQAVLIKPTKPVETHASVQRNKPTNKPTNKQTNIHTYNTYNTCNTCNTYIHEHLEYFGAEIAELQAVTADVTT